MPDSGNNHNSSVIRIILCVAVLIILFLGMFGILPRKITTPAADVLLIVIAVWNGISYFRDGRKKQAFFIFAAAVVLFLMLILHFITF